MPFFNYTLEFYLQPRKSKENIIQGSRLVLDITGCVEQAVFLGAASTGLAQVPSKLPN
jgi:hypothetical protein